MIKILNVKNFVPFDTIPFDICSIYVYETYINCEGSKLSIPKYHRRVLWNDYSFKSIF